MANRSEFGDRAYGDALDMMEDVCDADLQFDPVEFVLRFAKPGSWKTLVRPIIPFGLCGAERFADRWLRWSNDCLHLS